ncbi:MAG: hypothetical protein WC767_02270 [Candidatus Paceibacterota bacterium]|jgi:hypothetical protein
MSKEEKKDAPVEESKKPETPAAPASDKKPSEEKKEPTIGEELGIEDKGKKPDAPAKENLIPEAAFLEEKKGRKKAEKALEDLQAKIAAGESGKEEISADIEALAEEYGIDKNFLKKFEAATTAKAKAEAKKELEEEAAKARKPQEEKDRAEKIDNAFKKGFGAAMEKFPELKEIVVPSVIKTLSLDPANQDKTFSQLIEETYGAARSGKRTIENPTPRGGKEPGEVDFARAAKDTAYFNEIMADPDLKKKYNSSIEKRISL